MNFIDRATICDGTIRETADGYRVAMVPVARTGIQDYAGYEMGKPEMARVRVYRPPDEVFADQHLISICHKPVTNDHPKESVSPATWKRDSVGYMGEGIQKDEANGRIIVPMMFCDAGAIEALDKGKRQLSMGYTCSIDWTAGMTDSGEQYDAIQRDIRANHCALVDVARGGYSLRVGDAWSPIEDEKEPSVATKTVKIATVADGMPFEVTDAAEAVILNLVSARDAALEKVADEQSGRIADKTANDAAIVAKDAEIAALTAKLADAVITPEKLRDAARSYADTMAKAKAMGATVTDATSEADAMKAVVDAKMGDKAKNYSPELIRVAFDTLTADVKPVVSDAFRDAVAGGTQSVGDGAAKAKSAYDQMVADLEGGYKGKAA